MKIYIASPYHNGEHADLIRLKEFFKEREIEWIDPMVAETEKITSADKWEEDLKWLDSCNVIFALIPDDRRCRGIFAELEYSYHEQKIMIVISEYEHPFLSFIKKHGICVQYNTINDFIEKIERAREMRKTT